MAPHVLLLNGPNLNLLGYREPATYGSTTLETIISNLEERAASLSLHLTTFQSNHEGLILDHLHSHYFDHSTPPFDFVIVNPGALTHTSVALRDALLGIAVPFIEVHISNVHAREAFRHHSYLSDKAEAVIAGLGVWGYEVALEYAQRYLREKAANAGEVSKKG